ncbi:hypothetical protein L596_025829 [Steinernema carpocapsae]|uniref:Uncharacterized protein n=1 Tax=Steinernema carpocapsae TaxID=34508 RepID=A0A4U5M912_STECR|nr:hypothetical protein L596_025829 [Steinernema carpocapsae]
MFLSLPFLLEVFLLFGTPARAVKRTVANGNYMTPVYVLVSTDRSYVTRATNQLISESEEAGGSLLAHYWLEKHPRRFEIRKKALDLGFTKIEGNSRFVKGTREFDWTVDPNSYIYISVFLDSDYSTLSNIANTVPVKMSYYGPNIIIGCDRQLHIAREFETWVDVNRVYWKNCPGG